MFPDVKVGSETQLRCEGDGSPAPRYEWQQLVAGGEAGMTRILRRANTTLLNIRSDKVGKKGSLIMFYYFTIYWPLIV